MQINSDSFLYKIATENFVGRPSSGCEFVFRVFLYFACWIFVPAVALTFAGGIGELIKAALLIESSDAWKDMASSVVYGFLAIGGGTASWFALRAMCRRIELPEVFDPDEGQDEES